MQGTFVNDGATNNFFDSAQTDEGAVFDLLIILRDVVLIGCGACRASRCRRCVRSRRVRSRCGRCVRSLRCGLLIACRSSISRSRLRCLCQRTSRREGFRRSNRSSEGTSRLNRSSKRTSRCYRLSRHCGCCGHCGCSGCLNWFSIGRLILKRGLLLIRRFLRVRGLLRERGFLCMLEFRGMLGFRGALLLRTQQRNHAHQNHPPEQSEPAELPGAQSQADQPEPAAQPVQPGQPAEVLPRGRSAESGQLPTRPEAHPRSWTRGCLRRSAADRGDATHPHRRADHQPVAPAERAAGESAERAAETPAGQQPPELQAALREHWALRTEQQAELRA